jgi:hypothetical protein
VASQNSEPSRIVENFRHHRHGVEDDAQSRYNRGRPDTRCAGYTRIPLGVVFAHDLDAALQSALCLAGHAQGSFLASEPGDPTEPARVVPIAMIERYGMMLYLPDRVEVRRNEQIRFILTNVGDLGHEFVLATTFRTNKSSSQLCWKLRPLF